MDLIKKSEISVYKLKKSNNKIIFLSNLLESNNYIIVNKECRKCFCILNIDNIAKFKIKRKNITICNKCYLNKSCDFFPEQEIYKSNSSNKLDNSINIYNSKTTNNIINNFYNIININFNNTIEYKSILLKNGKKRKISI